MRDAADWGGNGADVGKVLFGGNALHPLRYRGDLSLSVGGDLQDDAKGKRSDDPRIDGLVPARAICRVSLRIEKRGL